MIGKCKHEWKHKIGGLTIQDLGGMKDINGKEAVFDLGRFELYRCMECKCVVWEAERKAGR